MVHHLLDGVVSGETGVATHHLVRSEVLRAVVRRHVEKFLRRLVPVVVEGCVEGDGAAQVDPHAAALVGSASRQTGRVGG